MTLPAVIPPESPTTPPPQPEYNPYELLGKPTLELTDAELSAVVTELRLRRKNFLLGQQDKNKPAKAAKPKALPKGKEVVNADDLLGDL